ncbi:MAG: PA2779 family protein [Desulfobacterales bacterium]|nr:PA2779 family protein [Desulfobacterales bacterium]
MQTTMRRFFIYFLATMFFCTSSLVPAARAAMINTTDYIKQEQSLTRDKLLSQLERSDVQERLVSLGVDPDDARRRIAGLSQEELTQMQQKMDDLPAGSNLLAVLGILLIVLIVLELVGVTNVFSRL